MIWSQQVFFQDKGFAFIKILENVNNSEVWFAENKWRKSRTRQWGESFDWLCSIPVDTCFLQSQLNRSQSKPNYETTCRGIRGWKRSRKCRFIATVHRWWVWTVLAALHQLVHFQMCFTVLRLLLLLQFANRGGTGPWLLDVSLQWTWILMSLKVFINKVVLS